jgi:hypothetical protein
MNRREYRCELICYQNMKLLFTKMIRVPETLTNHSSN